MARARSPNRDKAFEIYKEHNGNIDLVSIAEQLGVSSGTVRGWKAKDKWDDKLNGALQKNTERSVNIKDNKKTKKVTTKRSKKSEVVLNDELTEKQRLFCIYYIENFNATKAYQRAYDCDYQTANRCGPRLLVNVGIKAEINRLTEECLQEQCISSKLLSKRLFESYIKIAFADITDYLEFNKFTVKLKNSKEVDGTLIGEVSEGRDGIKIKLQDKMKALDWLDKHIGLASEEQRLKIDRLRAEIDKLRAELNKITDNDDTELTIKVVRASEETRD